MLPSNISVWKSILVPPFHEAQESFSINQSKCNAHMLLISQKWLHQDTLVLAPRWSWLCCVCLAGLAVVTTSWTKYLSTLQRPKGVWTLYLFVCLSHTICLSDICAHLLDCQDSRRTQVCVFPIFIVEWTAEWTAISCLWDKQALSKQPHKNMCICAIA